MMRKLLFMAAAAALFLGACSSDDGGASLSDDQQEVVDMLNTAMEEEGLAMDQACAEDVASNLSDEDAAALVAAGVDGDPELSAEGEALGTEIFGCLDRDAFIDSMISEISDSGATVDEDCVRDALSDFEMSDLAEALESDEPPDGFLDAILGCVEEE
ncbi:hypothetical protein [Rhabdothermincola salaria]|uniref:hypothetical protein n=1 Tax=Rhabdothermincola salaria TaxID=2903142 RepID=UPI001E3CACCD|nr:hypothetical protein [Rhabdothermincola salaria]MCD9624478.1 hypothetical protein [Rhabdothermincola salaria]